MRISNIPFWSDIKYEYLSLRKNGANRNQATEKLQERYASDVCNGAEDDGTIFWIALADGQWENREISFDVAQKAMAALNVLEGPEWMISRSDISRRRRWYFNAPMPEKVISKISAKFRCKWNVGDTFAYQLLGPLAEQNNVSGQFILMRKVSDVEFGDGRLLPVVTLSLWGEKPFPQNSSDFCNVPLLKLNRGRLGLPDNLYEYRTQIVIKSEKQLHSIHLEYVGNFANVPAPNDEVIIENAAYMCMEHPEFFDRDFNVRIRSSREYCSSNSNVQLWKSRLSRS